MEKPRVSSWDMAFWILILLIISVAVWKLIGSPTDTAALISVSLFFAGSEILLWRALFALEKRTSCGFMKIKYDLDSMKSEMNAGAKEISSKLNNIENLIKKK